MTIEPFEWMLLAVVTVASICQMRFNSEVVGQIGSINEILRLLSERAVERETHTSDLITHLEKLTAAITERERK